MSIMRKVVSLVVVVVLIAGAAHAIPPAYEGPKGNPEEPALRPFKWFLRGVQAMVYFPVTAFRDGNRKSPVLGSVEVFRGIRRGAVELDASVLRGAIMSVPPPKGDYKKLGKVNTALDEGVFRRNEPEPAAPPVPKELPAEAVVIDTAFAVDADSPPMLEPVSVAPDVPPLEKAQQRYVGDRIAVNKKAPLEKAQQRYVGERVGVDKEVSLDTSQKRYVGDRIRIHKKAPYTGNILKQLKRKTRR